MPWTRPPANRVIALATDGRAPGATQDDALVLSILAERCAARIEAVAWDSPRLEWGRYGAVLIRSTWDYHLRLAAFLDWTERVEAAGVALWNPAAVVRWNADKRYLHALARAGVPVVPTERIHRGTATDLRSVLHRRGWNQVVVKPSVSAAAFQTWVTHLEQTDTHSALLSAVLARGDALVQPFLPEVRGEGEWSFVYFADGGGALAFSHAVVKRPAPGDFRVQSPFGGTVRATQPSSALLRQATDAAATVARIAPGPLLYARIDGVVSAGAHAPAGTFLLMEAELIEPILFLACAAQAAERFAAAVAQCLTVGPASP